VRQGFKDQLELPDLAAHSAAWSSVMTFETDLTAQRFETPETSPALKVGVGDLW
jgi:hypothetical protein